MPASTTNTPADVVNFVIPTKDGKSTEPLSANLVPFATDMLPLLRESTEALATANTLNRAIAEILVNVRVSFQRPAGLKVKFDELIRARLPEGDVSDDTYTLPAGPDYTAKTAACKKAQDDIWAAVMTALDVNVEAWCMATMKPASWFPVRKAVEYHIDRVIRDRFDGDYDVFAVQTGHVPESPGAERAARAEELSIEPKGRPAKGTVSQQVTKLMGDKTPASEAILVIATALATIKVSELKGADKAKVRSAMRKLAVQATKMADSLEPAAKNDARRERAANAA
jgi:hypothetical protein